jgi:N-acetylglucosamine-6-phosphate deacetylase
MNGNLPDPRGSGPLALVNGRLVLPDEIVTGQALLLQGTKIAAVAGAGEVGTDIRQIDVRGRTIAPGLIDIHTHGALRHTFNEATEEAFAVISRENARRGVTSLLATTTTAPLPNLVACMVLCRQWMDRPPAGAQLLGVHLEGPYFCNKQRGTQDPAFIRTPDDGSPDALLEHHEVIKIMSYAPELPGALELTERVRDLDIVPAAGHSCARDEEVVAAMQRGLRHVIHIWSGQSSTVREGPWRKPGLLEASLAHDALSVEMIADNRHLPPTLMKLAYRCIGPQRLCAISDATCGAGLEEGARFHIGNVACEVHDGVAMLLDRSQFAGSTTFLSQMIPILTNEVGIPLVEAIRMASLTPAQIIGVADHKGGLEAGKDADLVIFDDDLCVRSTMVGGRWVTAD